MASKRRIRRKSCLGKARHRSRKGGQIEIAKAKRRRYTGFLSVYRCKFCGGYHIGH